MFGRAPGLARRPPPRAHGGAQLPPTRRLSRFRLRPRRRGENSYGQLGEPGADSSPHPVPRAVVLAAGGAVLAGAESVSAGENFACARGGGAAGAAWCWGSDGSGQLGDGAAPSTATGAVPVANPGGVLWAQVEAYRDHACGRSAAGAAYCWGDKDRVGVSPAPGANVAAPAAVSAAPAPKTWARLSTGVGAATTLAVAADTTLYGWGAPRARARRLSSPPPRPRAARSRRPRPARAQGKSTTSSWATASTSLGRPATRTRPCARAWRPAPAPRAPRPRRATRRPARARKLGGGRPASARGGRPAMPVLSVFLPVESGAGGGG